MLTIGHHQTSKPTSNTFVHQNILHAHKNRSYYEFLGSFLLFSSGHNEDENT